jgi:hypothetical protein
VGFTTWAALKQSHKQTSATVSISSSSSSERSGMQDHRRKKVLTELHKNIADLTVGSVVEQRFLPNTQGPSCVPQRFSVSHGHPTRQLF